MIRFKSGFKYQLENNWRWHLKEEFTIKRDFKNDYYGITRDGWLYAYKGCAWDGATLFPDFDWIMEGSLGHDILHWLIEKGIIPELENDLIDKELEHIIKVRGKVPRFGGKWLLNMRAWYVRKATNLVDQKYGVGKKIQTISRGSL